MSIRQVEQYQLVCDRCHSPIKEGRSIIVGPIKIFLGFNGLNPQDPQFRESDIPSLHMHVNCAAVLEVK